MNGRFGRYNCLEDKACGALIAPGVMQPSGISPMTQVQGGPSLADGEQVLSTRMSEIAHRFHEMSAKMLHLLFEAESNPERDSYRRVAIAFGTACHRGREARWLAET